MVFIILNIKTKNNDRLKSNSADTSNEIIAIAAEIVIEETKYGTICDSKEISIDKLNRYLSNSDRLIDY